MAGFLPWRMVDLWLESGRSIWVATTRPDGRPHAVPVWYVWEEPTLWFVTDRTSQKARNLARQPWAVVHAGDGDDVAILEGPAEVVTDREELARVELAYREKYVDPHSGARATIVQDDADLWRVRVERAMAWEYGVVATRTDWRFNL